MASRPIWIWRGPSNLTAMGGALQSSIRALGALPATGTLILFTDGMQNVSLMVVFEPMPPARHEIRDDPSRPQSGLAANGTRPRAGWRHPRRHHRRRHRSILPRPARRHFDRNPYQSHRPYRHHPRDRERRGPAAVFEALIDTLRVASPQLLAYRRGVAAAAAARPKRSPPIGADGAVVQSELGSRTAAQGAAFKNGADVIASAGLFAATFSPSTRRRQQLRWSSGAALDHRTGWRRYQAAAIMDEPDLSCRVRLTEPRVRVGSPLSLVVDVNARQRPIDGRVTVTATVEQPRRLTSLPTRGRRTRWTGLRARHDGGAERQFAALATDTERWRH